MFLSNSRFFVISVLLFLNVAVSLNIPYFNGTVRLLLFLASLSYVKFDGYIHRYLLYLIVFFVCLLIATSYHLAFSTGYEVGSSLYRLRFWFFEFLFSTSLFWIFSREKVVRINFFTTLMLYFFFFVSIFQFLTVDEVFGRRANLLVNEPSQAGGLALYFLCSYLMVNRQKLDDCNVKVLIALSIITMMLTGSKGVILTIGFTAFVFFILSIKSWKKILLTSIFTFLFVPAIYVLLGEKLTHALTTVYTVVSVGVNALSYDYGVWDSYIMRFLGWFSSLDFFIHHPLGIGAGGFDFLLPELVARTGISVDSRELYGVIYGDLYATPKSYFLELIVSGGLVAGWGVVKILSNVIKRKRECEIFVLCALALLFQGLVVELNPYLGYLYAIVGLSINQYSDDRG